MLLSILIPTYNRAKYLKKNLYLLESYIVNNDLIENVEIIISNNHSNDNTERMLTEFKKSTQIKVKIYNQRENLGLEKNALFCLSKSESDYVIYTGDDDYINEKYLLACIDMVYKVTNLRCILPSSKVIYANGCYKRDGRDLDMESKIYNKGFINCLINSYRGHSISGVCFKREGTYKEYMKNQVSNIYPFIYFVAYNSLKGKTLNLTKYPIQITDNAQANKDWDYDEYGRLNDVFDNYKKLNNISELQRTLLEIKFISKNRWRLRLNWSKGIKYMIKQIKKLYQMKNMSYITKIILPLFIPIDIIEKMMIKLNIA